MRNETISAIEEHKVFAIVRGLSPENVRPTMNALVEGGIRLVEVTFDRKNGEENTLAALDILATDFSEQLIYGAGTVTTTEQVEKVKALGGQFIVSPDFNPEVIKKTRELEMVSLPGVMTPTEAVQADAAGADFIKLFPGGLLGPGYLAALSAPLSDLKFIAVGGVNADNIPEFANAGAVGFGIGSNLVNNSIIENRDFDKIYQSACDYKQAIESIRK
ncbi:bifunctional 4-hydroxy-2-oxoglutarate aldolase/2-dehydro-3-deoxy-phosphogluconate aldolase [Vibrio maerlii]|uniref:bifunctional 4-hydroxy-2-oxoglutarate aldolase/2-dehydro-3-deoxy-phosphogluconate aldolase n=1 Tax=Vibrio maerlii TaxID=2231648 RepID=UPI000E3D1B69|nr:bifunctional 4-hydroxy-2-oxoglutarate aldolase/2-dehydro-3-deoxy-phosphogluconate aldolase [Vibrio maerlii]